MKIGVFDSGLGGLVMARAIRERLPHDMVYLGDTLHVPYGGRSAEAIYTYTSRAVHFLFEKKDCNLVAIACNTASASALRALQQQYLPEAFPQRRILGVIVPTLEAAIAGKYRRLGLIGTNFIVQADVYRHELEKLDKDIRIFQQAAPLLVSMIEQGGIKWIRPVLEHYLAPLVEQNIDALVLGCTHYPILKDMIRGVLPENVDILSQDEIVPSSLADYLRRHPEIAGPITAENKTEFLVTDVTQSYSETARQIYAKDIAIQKVAIGDS